MILGTVWTLQAQMHHVTRNEAPNAMVTPLGDVQPTSFIPASNFDFDLPRSYTAFRGHQGTGSLSFYSCNAFGVWHTLLKRVAYVSPQQSLVNAPAIVRALHTTQSHLDSHHHILEILDKTQHHWSALRH